MTSYHILYAIFAALIIVGAMHFRLAWIASATALVAAIPLLSAPWGKPKPFWSEVMCRPDAAVDPSSVLAAQSREKEGRILVWLQVADCEPTAYSMPWNAKMAEQLQQALEEAERNGTGVKMRFERSYDRRPPKFYALPQVPLPDKPPPKHPLVVVPEQSA